MFFGVLSVDTVGRCTTTYLLAGSACLWRLVWCAFSWLPYSSRLYRFGEGEEFHTVVTEKKFSANCIKQEFFFFGKNVPKLAYSEGKKFWNCHILTVGLFLETKQDSNFFFPLLSSLTGCQIWLVPLVDDRQFTYLTKIYTNIWSKKLLW
jgi:hypothetical protein